MLQVVPLNVPTPDSKRAAPMLPASVMRGQRCGLGRADVGAGGDDVARAREDVGPLRQRGGGNATAPRSPPAGQARRRRGELRAQVGLGDAGERDQRLHVCSHCSPCCVDEDAALRRAGARQRGVGARLEAALHAELGQARRLGARRRRRGAPARAAPRRRAARRTGSPSRRRRRRARRATSRRRPRAAPRRRRARRGCGRRRRSPSSPAGRCLRSCTVGSAEVLAAARPALAVASSDGSSAAPAAARRARASAIRARGARDRRARGARRRRQAGEQRVVELRPPAAQLADRRRRAAAAPARPDATVGSTGAPPVAAQPARPRARANEQRRQRGRVSWGAKSTASRARRPARRGERAAISGAARRRGGAAASSARRRGWSRKKRSISRDASGPSGRCTSRPPRRPTRRAARPDEPVLGQASAHRRRRRRRARRCARTRALPRAGVAGDLSRATASTPPSAAAMTASPFAGDDGRVGVAVKDDDRRARRCGRGAGLAPRAGVGQRVAHGARPGRTPPPGPPSSPRTPRRRRARCPAATPEWMPAAANRSGYSRARIAAIAPPAESPAT